MAKERATGKKSIYDFTRAGDTESRQVSMDLDIRTETHPLDIPAARVSSLLPSDIRSLPLPGNERTAEPAPEPVDGPAERTGRDSRRGRAESDRQTAGGSRRKKTGRSNHLRSRSRADRRPRMLPEPTPWWQNREFIVGLLMVALFTFALLIYFTIYVERSPNGLALVEGDTDHVSARLRSGVDEFSRDPGARFAEQSLRDYLADGSGAVAVATGEVSSLVPDVAPVIDGPAPTPEDRQQAEIERLLKTANGYVEDNRLTLPPGDNALDLYRAVAELEPLNAEALSAITRLFTDFVSWGKQAADRQDWAGARKYFKKALLVRPGDDGVLAELEHVERELYAGSIAAVTEAPVVVDNPRNQTRTALMQAVADDDTAAIESLIGRTDNIDAVDEDGNTALILSSWSDQPEVTRAILDAGADVNRQTLTGWTALLTAAVSGSAATVRVLLDAGGEPGLSSFDGKTPLMAAVWNGHVDVARVLLQRGIDINQRNTDGWTALFYAAWRGDFELIQLLLDAGADPGIPAANGDSVADVLALRGYPSLNSLPAVSR